MHVIVLSFLFSFVSLPVWAQLAPQEQTEEAGIAQLEREVVQVKKNKSINSSIEVSTAFDTNAQFGGLRKGDIYQQILYSASFLTDAGDNNFISVNYDVNALQYNEFTDISNLLNHLRLGFYRAVTQSLVVGVGLDESFVYFPNNSNGAFYFHKGFAYLKHQLTPALSHQIQFERGLKDYARAKPYADTSSDYQDKERQDMRQSVEYSMTNRFNNKVKGRLRGKYTSNDGNAQFQDYYDYYSVDLGPKLYYQVAPRWLLSSAFNYNFKKYKNRLSTTQDSEQKDHAYEVDLDVDYQISTANSVGLSYSYANTISNDGGSEYSNNTVKLSLRHDF